MALEITSEMALHAQEIYDSLIKWLDANDWKYEKSDAELSIRATLRGDDLFMEFVIAVDAKREIISYTSQLPFDVPQDMMVDMALAVAAINNHLLNGYFEYDLEDSLFFKMSNSYAGGSPVNPELFRYLIGASSNTIDEYNDRLFMLTKGVINAESFFEEE